MDPDPQNAKPSEEALVRLYMDLTGVTELCARAVVNHVRHTEADINEAALKEKAAAKPPN
jgi:hypothetical protein